MANDLSVDQLRAKLEEKREWHLAALREIEEGLRGFDRLLALAGVEKSARLRDASDLPSAPKAVAQPAPPSAQQEEGISEKFWEVASSKAEPFDMRIKEEVRERFRLETDDKQASNALRNLLKRGKIKLVRAGGPRKPAVYANLDYVGTEAGVPEEAPSPLFSAEEEI